MKAPTFRRLLRMPAPGRCWLAIQQQQSTPSFWAIVDTCIEELAELPAQAWPVLSISPQDLRAVAAKPVGAARSRSLIRQQCGQAARAINLSAHGSVYGRTIASLPARYPLTPATILIDAMLQERGWPQHPFVVGLLLTVPDSDNQILALWSGTARRELSEVQATENAHNPEPILEAFCTSHGIEPSADTVILFELQALLQAVQRHADRLYAYPDYDDWHGIPIATLWRGAAITAAGLAAGCIAMGSWHAGRAYWLAGQHDEALLQEATARQAVIDLFKRNIGEVTARSSVDHRALVANARSLYVEGGWASLIARGATHTIRITVPIESPTTLTGSGEAATTEAGILRTLLAPPGAHVSRPLVTIGGGGNEVNLDHRLAAPNARLLGYLDR